MTTLTLITRIRQMTDDRLADAIEATRGCDDLGLTTALANESRRRATAPMINPAVFAVPAEAQRLFDLVANAN